jgi:[acyl-carrier-protein] S-malonyltransferase
MDFVLLFPGQGSQKPGMGADLIEAFPAARETFATADRALGVPLTQLCVDGPAEELTLTHNAQPALLTHGAAVWAVVRDRMAPHVRASAGHSLGEFTAHHAAGSITLEDGVRLVRRRGELMYQAGVERPGAMAAILGETSRPIDQICAEASQEGALVVPANYNAPGQVVISGEVAGVERAMELLKEAGARRAVRLNVSGAFHSPLMAPAAEGLDAALTATPFADPAFPVYANVNAAPVTNAGEARVRLLDQLSNPVKWTDEVGVMAARYPKATFVEMGPGAVLAGLVRKIAPDARVLTCGTAAEVTQLLEMIA